MACVAGVVGVETVVTDGALVKHRPGGRQAVFPVTGFARDALGEVRVSHPDEVPHNGIENLVTVALEAVLSVYRGRLRLAPRQPRPTHSQHCERTGGQSQGPSILVAVPATDPGVSRVLRLGCDGRAMAHGAAVAGGSDHGERHDSDHGCDC